MADVSACFAVEIKLSVVLFKYIYMSLSLSPLSFELTEEFPDTLGWPVSMRVSPK